MIFNDDFRKHLDKFTSDAFIISDPPYNQNYHYSEYSDKLAINDYGEMLRQAFYGHKAVIIHYPEETINILGKILGNCEQVVSWVYNSNTAKQSRLISWWNCKPDFRKIGQDYKNPTDKRIMKRIAEGKKARAYDWWEINQVKNVSKDKTEHPCQMPLEVMKRIIGILPKDFIIVDPFAGSGTTAVACKELGRQFIMIEQDKEFHENDSS